MIVSMTGFGKGETQFQNKKITVELRTLNSKNIDLNFRTPHATESLNHYCAMKLTKLTVVRSMFRIR